MFFDFLKMSSPPADRLAGIHVDIQLTRGMNSRDIRRAVEYICDTTSDLSEEDIERAVSAKKDDILDQLSPLINSWRQADADLAGAKEKLELGTSKTSSNRATVSFFAASATLCISIICAYFFDPEFLLGIFLAAIFAVPLYLVLANRAERTRNLSIPGHERARDEAEKRFEVAAKNQATVAIRETINEWLTSFSTDFRILDQRGLRALADPEREVSTVASEELSTLMASLSSGSIGLSGPRGAGKTTLIDSFARGRSVLLERERIGLVVSAPVKYDAREFVLHLFASLCERMIGEGRLDYLQSTGTSLRNRRRTQVVRFLENAALLVAAAGIAMLVFDKTAPEGPKETGYLLLAVAGLVALYGLSISLRSNPAWRQAWARWLARFSGEDPVTLVKTPEKKAQGHLEQIRFQQSVSSGWSGSVKAPLGIGFSSDSSITMARTPWSLPEAVEAFRKYAASLTKDHYLVIGIDELDKMGSDDTAREFLNNIKGVFGVTGCYYLVSISDDAMASFERRGLPVRDVFDSSFDAVQRIGYLTLSESRAILGSRVVGLPVPYQCLCHCMAGGLPRDLIRVARELVHQQKGKECTSLDELCHAVVEAELRAKMAGAIEMSREASGREREWVQKWLYDQDRSAVEVDELRESVVRLASCRRLRDDASAELAFEVATFNYYVATVMELFTDDPGFVEFLRTREGSTEIDPAAVDVLETLTKARQQFALGPGLAWSSITAVRAARGLSQWTNPRSAADTRTASSG